VGSEKLKYISSLTDAENVKPQRNTRARKRFAALTPAQRRAAGRDGQPSQKAISFFFSPPMFE